MNIVDEKEQSLIPAIPQDLAMAGLEEVGREDLIIPRVRIIQPTSKLEGDAGQFHFNLTGECRDSIHAVLLKMTKSRVCWDQDSLGADPLCASDDAKTPRGQYASIYATHCENCPMAQWGEEAPKCRLMYNFLATDLEGDLFIIGLGSTSVKHAKKILSVFTLKRKPLFSRSVNIASVQMSDERGKWYEIVITPNGSGRGFDWRPYAEMYQAYQKVMVTADTENPIDPAADEPEFEDDETSEIPF